MSERGSIASQYFYCRACAEATLGVFQRLYEYATPVTIREEVGGSAVESVLIVVAKTHCGYSGEELWEFEGDVVDELSKVLCHPARFAILADNEKHNGIALVTPGNDYATWLEPSRVGPS